MHIKQSVLVCTKIPFIIRQRILFMVMFLRSWYHTIHLFHNSPFTVTFREAKKKKRTQTVRGGCGMRFVRDCCERARQSYTAVFYAHSTLHGEYWYSWLDVRFVQRCPGTPPQPTRTAFVRPLVFTHLRKPKGHVAQLADA